MRLDPFKLTRWMNARKYTLTQTAELAGLPVAMLQSVLDEKDIGLGAAEVAALGAALRVEAAQLTQTDARDLAVVHQCATDMHASARPIQRDGIHFYNYYSLAGPEGRVAPVVLDILCPATRLPALNQGHLEPAITVNLGPGAINGRWGTELSPHTWQVLQANTGTDDWITGDSYVEPSYCPHSYSLAGDLPARIVSYTGWSALAGLAADVDNWPAEAFEVACKAFAELGAGGLLDQLLARRMHTRASAAEATGSTLADLDVAIAEPASAQALETLRRFGGALGFDYRVLLPPERRVDPVGKSWATVAEARSSLRRFGPYTVASMASAPHLSDLTGSFLSIDHGRDEPGAELTDHGEIHYFVVAGEVTLSWTDQRGPQELSMTADHSAWVAPFVRHRWHGRGSALKFGSGPHVGYQDWLELGSTFEPAATVRRSRRDLAGWGYDT